MKLPQIKPILFPFKRSKHRIIIGRAQYGIGCEIQDDEHDSIWSLIQLMDGAHTSSQIVSEMHTKFPHLTNSDIKDGIRSLTQEGFVHDASVAVPACFTAEEIGRYERNNNFYSLLDRSPHHDFYALQKKLKESKVVLVGVGANGSAIAQSLVASGVGALHCVDFDIVEETNLTRQLLFDQNDIGKIKAEVAQNKLQKLNPYCKVTVENKKIVSAEQIESLMKNGDVFIIAADDPYEDLREWTNKAALATKTPWIDNFCAVPTIGISFYIPFETPCYICGRVTVQKLRKIQAEDETAEMDNPPLSAIISPITNIAGHLTALEALYFLTGLHPRTKGKLFLQNLFVYDHVETIPYTFLKGCPACGSPTNDEKK